MSVVLRASREDITLVVFEAEDASRLQNRGQHVLGWTAEVVGEPLLVVFQPAERPENELIKDSLVLPENGR